jgi:hypothetical protein
MDRRPFRFLDKQSIFRDPSIRAAIAVIFIYPSIIDTLSGHPKAVPMEKNEGATLRQVQRFLACGTRLFLGSRGLLRRH